MTQSGESGEDEEKQTTAPGPMPGGGFALRRKGACARGGSERFRFADFLREEALYWSFLHAFALEKLRGGHALRMLHIQAEKIFVAGEDNVHIRHDGCV